MAHDVKSSVLEIFEYLDRLQRLQHLVDLAFEQFDDLEVDYNYQRVEILLDRYISSSEACFDEISILRSSLLKQFDDSLDANIALSSLNCLRVTSSEAAVS